MKFPGSCAFALFSTLLLVACVPTVDTQSVIETGIAQTQQISQLETAAADTGGSDGIGGSEIDTQSMIETGVAQTAQVSQLETAAAYNYGGVAGPQPDGNCGANTASLYTYAAVVPVSDDTRIYPEGPWGSLNYYHWLSGVLDISSGPVCDQGYLYWYVENSNTGSGGYVMETYFGDPVIAIFNGVVGQFASQENGEISELIIAGAQTDQGGSPSSNNSGTGSPTFSVSQETNCRYGPSASNFDVRRTIFKGQSVPIVGVGGSPAQDWWVVMVDGVECWVWDGVGQVSGNTQSVAVVNPPAPQQQGNDNGNDGNNDQPADACQINPVVMVDDSSDDVVFNLTGFLPNSKVYFEVLKRPENTAVYRGWIDMDGNGNGTIGLSFAASSPGQYLAVANNPECPNSDEYIGTAIFIID